MGGRSSEPVTACVQAGRKVGVTGNGSITDGSTADPAGTAIEWAHVQWQSSPSPSQQFPDSSAADVGPEIPLAASTWAMAGTAAPSPGRGPSARQAVPDANFSSSTNTASAHSPR